MLLQDSAEQRVAAQAPGDHGRVGIKVEQASYPLNNRRLCANKGQRDRYVERRLA